MSSHIHDLWDELDLPEEYPQVDPQAVLARVNAALDGDEPPKEKPMKRSLRWGLILAAVLVLLSGTVAAAYHAGVLSLFFQGDTSQLEPYVQDALDTAENEDYRLRVDSCLYDGQNVYAVVTVEALNDQAAQDLMSNRVIAESHRETWGEEMVESLLESGSSGPETFHCNQFDFSSDGGGIGIHDLPDPDDHSRSWQISVQFHSYVGPQEQPLEFWVDFMGRDCAVDIPLDNMAQPIRLTPNEEVIYNPYTNYRGILKEFILSPTSFSINVEHLDKCQSDDFSYTCGLFWAEDCFFLRMKDGTVLSRTQLGGTNDRFETVVDLSQVESIIYGYTEFPVDGSPSFPADLPENLYPFTCTAIIPKEEYQYYRFPVEELCQKLGADYQWDEATQTATATYRDVTLTMTVGQSCYQRNGETVELILGNYYDETRPDYQEFPQYISIEDGVLTAPVVLLEDWSLDYPELRTQNGEPAGVMLVIP